MTEVLAALERLSKDITKLSSTVQGTRTKLVAPDRVDGVARSIADTYFGSVHTALEAVQRRAGLAEEVEFVVGAILQLSSEPREKSAYFGQVKELRLYLQEATIDVMKARGNRFVASDTERGILLTLAKMLPHTAASYEQVLQDIALGKRVSWRGTGAELREVLREVMDHLAPDREVMAAPGFRLESDLKRPTQKQKVRFILKARKRAVKVAADAVDTVEDGVARVARSTYERGSATTHSASDAGEIRKLKNYVDALLVELLEVTA